MNSNIVQDSYDIGKTTFQNACNSCHGYDAAGECSFLMAANSIAPQKPAAFKSNTMFGFNKLNFNFQFQNKEEMGTLMDQIKNF